jgi:hypothetical protein
MGTAHPLQVFDNVGKSTRQQVFLNCMILTDNWIYEHMQQTDTIGDIIMKSKNYLVLLVIFLFAFGGIAETGYAVTTWISTTDPGTNDPRAGEGPWQPSNQPVTIGTKLWIGVWNAYIGPKYSKNITINIGPQLTSLGATASKSYGYYKKGNNIKSSKVDGPFLVTNSNPRKYFISYKPQPDWEVLELDIPVKSFQRGNMALANAGIDVQVVANSMCDIATTQDITLTINDAQHEGPDDTIRITRICIFPEVTMVDQSIEPTFEGPPGSGTWTREFIEVDPEDNVQNLGVQWVTDGHGIEAKQGYSMTLTTIEPPGRWHSYFVFDEVSGEWQRFRLMAEERIPTLSQWGLIVMVVLLLTAGIFVIYRRQRVAA